ncbi:Protein ULTRAPETALA 2 [Striga hermonthica]|uniref:Protein ULTRAPETALA 2 n=1 Tax=Striga hermonthica TaxID=68872 RepID=A0A9N7MLZ6_STRHE|nr:Protein ULTRAPETALA 2 [Striga hermonthica]
MSSFYGVLQHREEFVEMDCGCTNPRYGDTPGKLRVYVNGKIEVDCICRDDCSQVNLSPTDFARHAGRTNAHTNWKTQIWVFGHDGLKIALRRTCLLKHHTEAFHRPMRQVVHRDEFKICSICNKQRRFSLRDKEACRAYHDALLNGNWKCSDMPNQPGRTRLSVSGSRLSEGFEVQRL